MPFDQAPSPYVIANRQRVSRSGDTLTLPLLLSRDPVEAREAATKRYADAHTGGATMGANVIPNVVGSWYTHNAPGAPVNGGAGTDFGDWSIMSPMFVGQTATWSRMSITHIGGFQPRVQVGVWELDDTTLLPVGILAIGTVDIPVGTNYTYGTYGVPWVQTTSNWIGLAIHGHGNGGGWFTFDIDKNNAGTGQFFYNTYGFSSTLSMNNGANVLATVVGGDGGAMPQTANLWLPYHYALPSLGIQLHSVP